ncbi:urease accessory protein UreD [Curvibacter sp. APW13]|uniref:urease accessory protein UreD n=1 Tax=Curvibacter sp. APW13 TaxID=3077236 RepID=UPI0028DD5006|nr:urease accessory protein UreD [Curvibacter sp. APW13]MDT8990807.1 urease accessory protein UreD [Curvibacter sp. APW13]
MPWHARLDLHYQLRNGKTVATHTHSGPLRVLQSLYPEGDALCHNVLVHPPGGLVGGDTLELEVHLEPGTQALVTTPGASRFYRSDGPLAAQHTSLHLAADARLQWLPLETIAYSGCQAENRTTLSMAPGAEAMGWDVTALGLPLAGQPFDSGRLLQHLTLEGVWLERGVVDASDTRLMDGPAGLAGRRCLATCWFVSGQPLGRARREQALEAARSVIAQHPLAAWAGATSPHPQVVVVRALAPVVEPAMELLRAIRLQWLQTLWQQAPTQPRIWAM